MTVHGELLAGLRLSPQQRHLWTLMAELGEGLFTTWAAVRIDGELDRGRLAAALAAAVDRHEILRTTFQRLPGMLLPLQVIQDKGHVPLIEGDEGCLAPFDLVAGPVLRAALTFHGAREHRLCIALPAVVSDAPGLINLLREVFHAYERGEGPGGEEPLQYADIAEWQNEVFAGEDGEIGAQRWSSPELLEALADPVTIPGLRPAAGGFSPAVLTVPLDRETAGQVAATSQRLGVSTEALLLAAWQVFLARLSGASRIAVAVQADGRHYEELTGALGALARHLPVASVIATGDPFAAAMLAANRALQEAVRWQEFFDWGRAGERGAQPPDFAFEWTPGLEAWSGRGARFRMEGLTSCADRFPLVLAGFGSGAELRLELRWDTLRLSRIDAARLAARFATLLHGACADPLQRIDELPLTPPGERHLVTVELNDTAVATSGRTMHALFEEQADLHPERPALVHEETVLTYAELDRRANGVAHRLRELGVGPESVVALCTERSPESIAGLLGILKAGGAYAPLDPGLPRERLAGMIAECGAPVLLAQRAVAGRLPETAARVVVLEDLAPVGSRPDAGARGENLVYVIFTSGSTGKPKGVAVEHRQLVNYVQAAVARLGLAEGGRYATVSTLAADLGNTMVFPALARGGCLYLIPQERATDSRVFAEYAGRHGLEYLKIVPGHLSALTGGAGAEGALPERTVVLGGEALRWDLVQRLRALRPSCRVFNHYGPTEATVGVLANRIDGVEESATVPLGRPLANVRIYLLDPGLLPVPQEIAGEVYIGGGCLARGYLGRPGLTAERFLPDPFGAEPGGRLYRTGDLARLLPDGKVEFLGRADDQVKIRGYRVEPGEVAAVLRAHPGVRDAAVVARQERTGEVSLAAYVVPAEAAEPAPGTADLLAFLRERMPEFMVPRFVVRLPALPLTPNGKLDRRALPAPEHAAGTRERVAPRTPAERLLAAIWLQVLRLNEVGVHDNFFELGGDSILSIQIISRANQAGLRLTPRQLFQHQTIATLAAVAGEPAPVEPAGPVTGELPLTPIQRWFFEQELPEPHHFNQSLLLRLRPGLDPSVLRPVLARLVEHHDALRLRFSRGPAGWEQVCAAPGGEPPCSRIDLRALPEEHRGDALTVAATALQGSLDLGARLLQAAVFDWGGAEPPRLALIVHHLAVDAVSWRILLEDLATACAQASQGGSIELPPRTTSYQAWAERLRELAGSAALRAELDTWLAIGRSDFALPVSPGVNTVGSAAAEVVELTTGETRALLLEIPEVYLTQINDVLLAALGPALARWARHDRPVLELEGHGREEVGEGADLSRTVGWFTSRYPVALELRGLHGPEAILRSVKEQLRRLPGRGFGFGVLRYLADDPEVVRAMAALPRPQVSFNYLGQLDASLPPEAPFSLALEPRGPERSPRNPRAYPLEVNARVAGGRLQVAFVHSRDQLAAAEVRALAGGFLEGLRGLIAHCLDPRAGGRTPSDFPLAGLDQARLDRLAERGRHLEDIYPLSPLQQGLLFHALYHPDSGSYFSPMSCVLEGDLDAHALRHSWEVVVDRHPILRTSFAWEGLERPLQLVHRRIDLPWEELDWRRVPEAERQQRLHELLAGQAREGFDLTRAPLMRLTLARTGESSWWFVWGRHHLLIDGWTTSLILNEVFRAYAALASGMPWIADPSRPFRDYIAWLSARDLDAAAGHWRRTLDSFVAPTPVPVPPEAAAAGPSEEAEGEVRIKLSPEEDAAVEAFARRHQITLNTLFQGAWALLLAHYAGTGDVVFGGVVSGRPTDLPGADTIAGPFINTLPVRVQVQPASPLAAWLRELQAAQAEQRQLEHSPLVDVQGWSGVPRGLPLFETILVFENHPMELAAGDGSVRARDIRHTIRNSYALTLRPVPMATLELHMLFDRSRVPAVTATALLQRLQLLLARMLAAPETVLGELIAALAAEDERHRQELEKAYDDSLLQKFKSARRRAVSSSIGEM